MSDEQLDLLNWDGNPLPKRAEIFEQEYACIPSDIMEPADDRDRTLKRWAEAYLEFADSFGPGYPQPGEVRRVLDYRDELSMQANLMFPDENHERPPAASRDLTSWICKLRHHRRRLRSRSAQS